METKKITKETTQMILRFFKLHTDKDYCLADSTDSKEMCFWRKDIPYLEKLIS